MDTVRAAKAAAVGTAGIGETQAFGRYGHGLPVAQPGTAEAAYDVEGTGPELATGTAVAGSVVLGLDAVAGSKAVTALEGTARYDVVAVDFEVGHVEGSESSCSSSTRRRW